MNQNPEYRSWVACSNYECKRCYFHSKFIEQHGFYSETEEYSDEDQFKIDSIGNEVEISTEEEISPEEFFDDSEDYSNKDGSDDFRRVRSE